MTNLREKRNFVPSSAKMEYFPLTGGLNTEDPALTLKAGEVIAGRNYEVGVRGRYRRMGGYERFDGQALPSSEDYYRLAYTSGALAGGFSSGFSNGFDPARVDLYGALCTGGVSGATGTVVLFYDGTSSRDQAGDGYVILVNVSGAFQSGEALTFTINVGFSSGFSNGFE